MVEKNEVCVVKLPGIRNFAVVYPGNILFGLDATDEDLESLMFEAYSVPIENINEHSRNNASLGIIVTFDCNLRCEYCYARGGESKELISFETAKEALNSVRESSDGDYLDLFLVGGGEPLLYFERVLEIVEYAKTLFDEVQVNVVSNGTFGNNACEWLIKNNAGVRVSFDGVRQNIQRPFADGSGSSSIVIENIKKLIQSGVDVIVQCIVTSEGLDTLISTVDLVSSLGVKSIKIEPALSTDVSRADLSMEPDPIKFSRAMIEVIKHIADKGYKITLDTGFLSEPSNEFYCGMPNGNKVLTPHGLITSCVEVARPNDPYADIFIYGKVENGLVFDLNKKKKLEDIHFVNQLGGCSNCNLRMICHGGCPMASIWKNGFPLKKSNFTCVVQHTLIPELLLLIATDDRIAPIVIDEVDIDRF
ncbi:radical SAM protein [Patescibacteria group bacterium]|nr:radical SAM protein [Patescibacteria group bacterium]